MSDKREVVSIKPKPDEEMVGVIIRLKANPDFLKYRDVFIKGRANMLALLSTAPAWNDRQCHYIQGRVHELSDLDRMINDIEEIRAEYEATKRAEGS